MRQQSGDASLLRRLNTAAILRHLRGAESATFAELAKAARVSRPTAEAVVEELLAEGWAEECGEDSAERQRGRPAKRFRFRASAGHVVGVSIGAYRLFAMVADLGGRVVATHRMAVYPEMPADERMAAIVGLVEQAATDLGDADALAGRGAGRFAAVGVGTTGVVDARGRVVKSIALPGWTGLELQAELSRMIPAPVLVENDMRLAVLAEHWRGVAVGRRDVVYLFTGNRMSLGLLIDGVPYRGSHGASGELGEQPGGLWKVWSHVVDYAMSVEPGELRSPGQAAEFAFTRALEGDPRAVKTVEAFATGLAEGLVTVVNPLDPEMVVIGGALSRGGELLTGPIQAYLNRVCLYPPEVVASRLGVESIVVGALKLALNNADKLLFS
ncbi:ROK family transcriptional regulator [Nonomuraea soli]|uniref:Putative NBD/HSP70 family sugar kinase n=1 Tax=Nonomuraea soli TaxID=1032476 RepID=A0A7W0CQ44_9ACTN|nr:ROK family protein [Nonomuraea soli]MBA2895294.1 putative NBD/HSP70 family sugar kinase [Nonomuraea soli]